MLDWLYAFRALRIDRANGGQPGRVLDIGCGRGLLLHQLRKRGWKVTGTELSEDSASYARDVLHAGAGGYGALMSAFGVGAAAGALSIAAVGQRFRREATALGAGISLGAGLVLLGLLHQFGLALAVSILCGLSMALNAIMTNTLLQTEAPDHLRGQVMGFYSFIVVGMAPFGSLQAGWISEHAGTPRAVLLGGSVCLVAAGITAWGMLRNQVRIPVEAP